ncbi:MAG TPA: hypothetical protein PLV50_02915 [Smithella sp.]|nr:hypothetical protein [Smithella sp.]HOG89462.1 hypothetical protein [Smithella sp.]
MRKIKVKNIIKILFLGWCALNLINCGSFGSVIKMPAVNEVPTGHYERIIKLNNPAAAPNETLAGLIFIKEGTSVCTDYPRQENIKSIDELTMMEKRSFNFFSNYTIEAEGRTFGYVSVPVDYKAILWRMEKDGDCRYKVQLMWMRERDSINEAIPRAGSGPHGN